MPRVLNLSQKIGIPLIGDGRQLMDMTQCGKCCFGYSSGFGNSSSSWRSLYITNGEPRDFRDLIEETLRGLGYPIRYRKIPAPLVSAISKYFEFIYKNLKLKGEPALTRYTYYFATL